MTSRPEIPADKQGFQKPIDSGKRVEVGMAVISGDDGYLTCSCGWLARHHRAKVVEDKAEAHVNKRHGGRAMWL